MWRPPAGDLCDAEDVNCIAGGGRTKAPSLLLLSSTANSSSSVSSRHKVRLNYAIEGLSLPRRFGGVFLPRTSAATNGGSFQHGELFDAASSDGAPPPFFGHSSRLDRSPGNAVLHVAAAWSPPETDLFTLSRCDPGESRPGPGGLGSGPVRTPPSGWSLPLVRPAWELHLCILPGSAQRRAGLSNIGNAYRAVYAAGSPRRAV